MFRTFFFKPVLRTTLSAAILLTGAITALLPASVAAKDIEDTILARQGYYKLLSHNLGALAGMAKGNIDYNAETAKTAAANLDALANLNLQSLYPPGSDNEAKAGKTRALLKIWEDFAGVSELNNNFKTATAALTKVAGDGLDALRPAVGAVGKKCGACHNTYRAKTF